MRALDVTRAREALGLTTEELAKELGVGGNTVARWETGVNPCQGAAKAAIKLMLKAKQALYQPSGAPSKLNTKVCKALIKGSKLGMTIKGTCQLAGISTPTYYGWQKRPEPEYISLFKALKKARGQGERALLKRLTDAAEKPQHWQAAAWILERSFGYAKPPTAINVAAISTPTDGKELVKAWEAALTQTGLIGATHSDADGESDED